MPRHEPRSPFSGWTSAHQLQGRREVNRSARTTELSPANIVCDSGSGTVAWPVVAVASLLALCRQRGGRGKFRVDGVTEQVRPDSISFLH